MTTETTVKGKWWLPSNPDYQVQGILRYSQNDLIKLEILGSIFPEENHIEKRSYPIFLGQAINGTKHTCPKQVFFGQHFSCCRCQISFLRTSK